MADSSFNKIHSSSPVSNSPALSDVPHEGHYGDIFGPPTPSTTLSLPETESPNEIEKVEAGGPYPARKLPNLNFAPTYEGSLPSSIHTHISALRSTTSDVQARYLQAVNSSTPQDPIMDRNLRTTVANALWNSASLFEEEKSAAQLLRYRELFTSLSQRHAESLASPSLRQTQHLVCRGQMYVAAIRLTSGQYQVSPNHSIAQGRHSSEASTWGWKPWREIALAERISERRRNRAEKEREKKRGNFKRDKTTSFPDGGDEERNEEEATHKNTNVESQTRWRRTPRKPSSSQTKRVHYSDGGSAGTEQSPNYVLTNISSPNPFRASLNDVGSSTDGTTSQEKLALGSDIAIPDLGLLGQRSSQKYEITWHIPVYHDISSPSPRSDKNTGLYLPTIATVTNAVDTFQRMHIINEPSGMGYVSPSSSGLGPGISPQISPKTPAPLNISSGNDASTVSTDEISDLPPPSTVESLSRQSSVSFAEALFKYRWKEPTNDSNSDSTVGGSRSRKSLRKIKTAIKSLPHKIANFPWSSSSEEDKQTSPDSSLIPSSSEQSWPLNNNIPPGYGLVPHPNRQKHRPRSEHLDAAVPQTRIHSPQSKVACKNVTITNSHSPPHPGTRLFSKAFDGIATSKQAPPMRHRESDPLTRTEKEYQEILTVLNELKRESRIRRREGSDRRRVRDRIAGGGER